jgi:putative secretion ATPase (PEP-CTERM system associated)
VYQSYYKLSGKPFRLSPDPAFFFPSRGHKRALAYLRYGLNQDEGFVVITGAPGTGKTTLAKILLQEMDASVVVAHLTTTQLEADDMLRMVAASFGLRYEGLDKAGLLKSLENFLLARSRERKRALLVIDEAQNLPGRSLEELRMLSNLQIGDKALLQIFLLGQEQFRNMLDDPMLEQLRQRVIANYHLTPLGADECQRYVESRLHHVGWNNDPHFAEVAHELIHQFSDGIPRRINMLCDRILLYGCMEETHEVTGEVVNLVKKEMQEEISGKSVDAGESEFSGPSEQIAVAKTKGSPETQSAQPEPANKGAAKRKPVKREPLKQNSLTPAMQEKVPATGLENLGLNFENINNEGLSNEGLTHEASAFDDSDMGDEFEELDIDYAMFEDKNVEKEQKGIPPAKAMAYQKKPTSNEKSANKLEDKISEMEEKYVKNDQQAASKQPSRRKPKQKPKQKKPTPEHTPSSDDRHVMGNTVQKTKPENIKSDTDESTKHSEISERDLFRVIPGGKSFSKIPGLADSETPATAASAKNEPSSSDVRLRRILRLVLAFHRSPSRFPGLDTPAQPLPEGITELLELAISDDQVLNQVSPAAVMGISPVMLRAAVRFFVRRALFTPEGDHYRTLGLHPGASLAQIEKHYDLLMRLLRQDKQRGSADSVERVGQAYEALSRGEHSASTGSKPRAKESKPVFEEDSISDSTNQNDNSDLVIDFDEVDKNPPQPVPSTFVAKPNERFNPATPGKMSRKAVRYASQLAVLGFGALVIILGLYIVQLEPSSAPSQKPLALASESDAAQSGSADVSTPERQRGLLFNDGSTDTLSSQSTGEAIAAINTQAESIQPLDGQSTDDIDEIEAMRRELLAKIEAESVGSVDETNQDYESPLISSLDSEKPTSQPSKAIDASTSDEPSPSIAEPAATAVESSPMAALASESSARPANQFEGRDIEIVEIQPQNQAKKPAQKPQSFSSIAARTQIPKSAKPAPAVAAAAPTQSRAQNANAQSTAMINETELLNLVDNFLAYYQAGNVKDVMRLFANDARTNNRTNAQGIQSDYTELFKSTTKRKMTISSLKWSVENDYARGIGNYQAQINPVGTQGSQTFTGNITIQVQKAEEGLKITRFYFSNQSVRTGPRMPEGKSAGPAAAPVAAAAAQPAAVTQADITAEDLQNLISRFAQTYANGDIDGLMSLFDDNAKTNDQNTAAGIRKDYMELFQGTATRQMVINNMKWTLNDQQATGQGPFEVNVQPKGANSITTVKGSLKLTIVKNGDKSKITEMIHTVK